jgi:hypothetical protein
MNNLGFILLLLCPVAIHMNLKYLPNWNTYAVFQFTLTPIAHGVESNIQIYAFECAIEH